MKKFNGLFVLAAFAVVCLASRGAKAQVQVIPASYVQERGDWELPPGELNELERRGFHDGIEGARRDADNHRRPNVNNRDEFRHPPVGGRDRRAYRHGFARGYQVGVERLMRGGRPEERREEERR